MPSINVEQAESITTGVTDAVIRCKNAGREFGIIMLKIDRFAALCESLP